MIRRERGLSLVELVFSSTLIMGLVVSLGAFAQTAIRWNEAADRTIVAHASAETLRRSVGQALLSGTLLDSLSVGNPPMRTWSAKAGALIVRSQDAYWVVEREGSRVVRRRIGFDGRVDVQVVIANVTRLSFELVKTANLVTGVSWRVDFAGRAEPVAGFLALRVEEPSASGPSAPVPTPRLEEGERR